jgi:hypothetical protein
MALLTLEAEQLLQCCHAVPALVLYLKLHYRMVRHCTSSAGLCMEGVVL